MSVVAAAMITSAVIGGVSARNAAKANERGIRAGMSAEERMADQNIAFQREMADQQRSDFAPWRDIGEQALNRIWEGVDNGDFEIGKINLEDDPGYRVRMQEGIEALDASASARGLTLSGAQQKALTQYGQEQGSKEYANAYARAAGERDTRFNILSGLSSGGRAAAAGQAGATSQLATTVGNVYAEQGRQQNISNQNIGRVRAGAYEDYATVANQAASNWLTYKGAA